MQQEERNNLLKELLIEEGLENAMIEVYQTLVETDLDQCFPPEQYETFNNLCKILFEESEGHRKAVGKIIKKYENHA